jgi:hypothetical protein
MMPVPLGNVVNVDHECGIGANNCGEWSGTALETTPCALPRILLTPFGAVNIWVDRVSIKPDGSPT